MCIKLSNHFYLLLLLACNQACQTSARDTLHTFVDTTTFGPIHFVPKKMLKLSKILHLNMYRQILPCITKISKRKGRKKRARFVCTELGTSFPRNVEPKTFASAPALLDAKQVMKCSIKLPCHV